MMTKLKRKSGSHQKSDSIMKIAAIFLPMMSSCLNLQEARQVRKTEAASGEEWSTE
jgi:hypothetical protein